MKISLRFNFYATHDTLDSDINEIHFKCLEHYKNIFNDVKICISTNDINDVVLIEKVEKKFFDIFAGLPIELSFQVQKNDVNYQESLFFKREIVDKLNNYDLVFFAHNKGITNVKKYDINNIYKWVVGMYYFSLNFFEDVQRSLLKDVFYTYGSFLTKELKGENFTKYGYRYLGTFFWLNAKRILNMCNNFPEMDGRTYDENFIGNTVKDITKCASYKGIYYVGSNNLYYYMDSILELLYSKDVLDEFYKFYDKIKEKK